MALVLNRWGHGRNVSHDNLTLYKTACTCFGRLTAVVALSGT
jgi:hypothetical protein